MVYKKTVSFLLCFVMLLLMTFSSASAEPAVDKLTIYMGKGEITDAFQQLCNDYQSATGITVEMVSTAGEDGGALLKSYLTSDDTLNMFTCGPGSNAETYNAYLADMSDLDCVAQISTSALAECTNAEGKLQGIPMTVEGYGLVCNTSLMDSAAIIDLASFTAYMESSKAAGINGLELSAENYFLICHILGYAFSLQDDVSAFTQDLINGDVELKSNEIFVEWANFYDAIRQNATADPLTTTYDTACGDFATGKAGMLHQGNWCYSMFANYEITFDMGMIPLPLLGNDKICASVPNMFCVNSRCTAEEQQASKDFIDWLYTSETGKSYLYGDFSFIPLIAEDNATLDPLSAQVKQYVADNKVIPFATSYWPTGIDVDLVAIGQEYFSEMTMTNDELLDDIQAAFESYK